MKAIFAVFGSRRMFVTLLLGFSSGIPLALTGSTLQAWLSEAKVDLTLIGIFALVGVPYTWKFLWAPLLDRYSPPGLAFLGRRRSWLLVSQLLLVAAIAAMAFGEPGRAPGLVATIAVVVAFLSATQDIVVDAYRTEIVTREEYAAGSSVYVMGYRIAMLVSGALALTMADHMPWKTVYLAMASTMLVGILATLFAPEPVAEKSPRTLAEAVTTPFVDFFRRPGSIEILVFIVLYKLDTVYASALLTKSFLDVGFTKTDIATAIKLFGMVATIVGGLAGGALAVRLGMKKSLWFFGIFQGLTTLFLAAMAQVGPNYAMLVATISFENFASGMGTAAYSAFLMLLCNKKFTATQYALLTSFMAQARTLGASPAGAIAKRFGVADDAPYEAKMLGWTHYYLFATLLMIPGLLLLLRYDRWQKEPTEG